MITSKKFIISFVVFALLYLLPEIFANEAMLYFTGGIIGGSLSEFFKKVINVHSTLVVFLSWLILIILLIRLYFYLKNEWLKYLVLIIIAIFLYIIDNLFVFIPVFNIANRGNAIMLNYLLIGVKIIIKSVILAWIYYKGSVKNIGANKP